MATPPSLILVGPTTTGKSAIARELASQLGGELINADKFYLYAGFSRTTGLQSSPYAGAHRHLFEILDPLTPCPRPLEYARLADTAIRQVRASGHLPIVEGCYHRYMASLFQRDVTAFRVFGIIWSSSHDLEAAIRRRVAAVFSDPAAHAEIEAGLHNGFRNSFVMSHGSMIRPLVEYHLGHISLPLAQQKAVADILHAAHRAHRRLLDYDFIEWHVHNPDDTIQLVRTIVDNWRTPHAAMSDSSPARRQPFQPDAPVIVYFNGLDFSGGPVRVEPSRFLDPLAKRGINTVRLNRLIQLFDYTGNAELPLTSFESSLRSCLPPELHVAVRRLVHVNQARGTVLLRGREYHLHLVAKQPKESARMTWVRSSILDNCVMLGSLTPQLLKPPSELTETEQAVVAVLMDHQKHYAMSMLFGAFHCILVQERSERDSGPKYHGPVIDKRLLCEFEEFCDRSIRNYYEFIIGNRPPKLAAAPQSVLSAFAGIPLPKKTDKGRGDGPSKLVFRDFDHPGQLIYYAGNVLQTYRSHIDCVISPLFGAVEIGFGLRAILDSCGDSRIGDVVLVRFSRHNERQSLNLDGKSLTVILPSFVGDELIARLKTGSRVVMIDDAVSTGLTLTVLREFLRDHLAHPIGLAAIEQDIDRDTVDYGRVFFDYVYRNQDYDSSGRHETFISSSDMVIQPIAHRSIKPITDKIRAAIEL